MATPFLSIFIISVKIVSLICLFISFHSYHWFYIDNYSVNKSSIQSLCVSYGAFCNLEDPMPLPSLIVLIPCITIATGLTLEIINVILIHFFWQHIRSMLNYFLEETSIALSFATTIHCIWVIVVHIRISMELSDIHLGWAFIAFLLAAILVCFDCTFSILRIMHNCRYEKIHHVRHTVHLYPYRHRSINDSDA